MFPQLKSKFFLLLLPNSLNNILLFQTKTKYHQLKHRRRTNSEFETYLPSQANISATKYKTILQVFQMI